MTAVAHASIPRLLVLHTLRLKGIATAEAVADHVSLPVADVEAELDELVASDLARPRRGRIAGFALTPEGRVLDDRLLAEELESSGAEAAIEAAYTEFLRFNDQLLAVCTAWQLRASDGEPHVNDHSDADYDRSVHDQLRALHDRVEPVLDQLAGSLDRFGGHRARLRTALERVLAGEHDWFTKPMFPSYHSVWFELHEDLLATLGRERAHEHAPEGSP